MIWTRTAEEIKAPADIDKTIIGQFEDLIQRPWTVKKVLDDIYLERVLYNLIYKYTLQNDPGPTKFVKIFEVVDRLLPRAKSLSEKLSNKTQEVK